MRAFEGNSLQRSKNPCVSCPCEKNERKSLIIHSKDDFSHRVPYVRMVTWRDKAADAHSGSQNVSGKVSIPEHGDCLNSHPRTRRLQLRFPNIFSLVCVERGERARANRQVLLMRSQKRICYRGCDHTDGPFAEPLVALVTPGSCQRQLCHGKGTNEERLDQPGAAASAGGQRLFL